MSFAYVDDVDIAVSMVLYKTDPEEVQCATQKILQSKLKLAIYLVDNSVPPISIDDLPQEATLIRPGINLGYGRGHNLAIRESKGRCRYHLVMNTDIAMDSSVIDRLVAFMDAHPEAGLVMPQVRYPDGSIQHLCRLLPDPLVLIGRRFFGWTDWAKRLNDRYELRDWNYDRVASFPFLSGCFMLMRRETLDRVGGFDERYFLYAEDLDLSRRFHQISETLFVPEVEIIHEYRSLKRRSWRQWLYALRSLSQYFTKWGWFFDAERTQINQATIDRLRAGNRLA